jgi:hypothetical protein
MNLTADIISRMAQIVEENLYGYITGMRKVHAYKYASGATEDKYIVLVRQPRSGKTDHWVLHTVHVHSDGQVGIVGSGSYYTDNAEKAQRDFFVAAGALQFFHEKDFAFAAVISDTGQWTLLFEDDGQAADYSSYDGSSRVEMLAPIDPAYGAELVSDMRRALRDDVDEPEDDIESYRGPDGVLGNDLPPHLDR